MRDRDYYPPMTQSQWERAPFNEVETPEKEFSVTISQTLSKSTTVCTQDYIPVVEDEWDGEMGIHEEYADTSNTDWKKVYNDCAMTPLDIIQKCGELCKYLLDRDMTSYGKNSLKKLMEECQDWVEDDMEVCED